MLKKETVPAILLESLHTLMEVEVLKNHRLVGGTALTLQIGHRISVDIDLFSDNNNNYSAIRKELRNKFGKNYAEGHQISSPMGKGINVFINNIKTDIIDWNIKFISPAVIDEGIRLASKEDIIPMKLHTFLCPAEYARYEKKDYTDLAHLLKEFPLEVMMNLYRTKYPYQLMSDRMILEGLKLHEMADKKFMPRMLNGVTWTDIKKEIDNSILHYSEKRIKK
ncbi:MAG: nucleotidyl transferase AbiEii/AbiGii toxin family protein [Bacteroidetes bacterium]|nr:nucleotidyl transferase AbiEii/AbiGii toxin family protein [Bacteroidota bacterium]